MEEEMQTRWPRVQGTEYVGRAWRLKVECPRQTGGLPLKLITRARRTRSQRRFVLPTLACILVPLLSAAVRGQSVAAPASPPTTAPSSAIAATSQPAANGDQLIALDLPPDGVEVRTLADIVSR